MPKEQRFANRVLHVTPAPVEHREEPERRIRVVMHGAEPSYVQDTAESALGLVVGLLIVFGIVAFLFLW